MLYSKVSYGCRNLLLGRRSGHLQAHEEAVGGGGQLRQNAGILHAHRLLCLRRYQRQSRQYIPARAG